ncbi:MAG: ABC transporter ATP-binding protein [Flavobacteriales bacterium]|nr:ABC transporter ATP-binding protein [Flavobacteriales bacterium]MDG1780341.1 ABC transporter ATP-binding protein [Flavobacteriales bacterium]MDG2246537.1 ABC transporter ATP-binding protein [Flavobacteriales bacterium]
MKKFWDIFRMVAKYKVNLYANIFFNLLNAVLSLFTFLSVVPFLRILFTEESVAKANVASDQMTTEYWYSRLANGLDSFVVEHGKEEALLYMCVAIVLLALLKNLVNYLALYSLATIRTGVARDLRKNLYDRAVDLPIGFYSDERKGDVISRMTNDLMEVEFSVIGTLEILFKSPIMVVISLATLFIISWKLTLFALIFLPVSGFLISRIAKSLKNAAKRGKTRLGDLISVIEETLGGLKVIKAFNGEKQFKSRFDEVNQSYFELMRKLYKREYLSSPMSEFISLSVIAILLYVGGKLVLSDSDGMSGDLFIGYLVVFSQIIPPAKAFSDAIFKINKGGASIERINEILHADVSIADKEDARDLEDFTSDIEFKNVRFSYKEEEVIKGIDLTIKKGQTVALVGPSGGGKSTLANLLGRFYDVASGEIKIDGTPITDLKLTDVRAKMGVVTQDSILFNDSVTSNIALGFESPDIAKVKEAARVANAEEFIKDLPGTYDFAVGDGGGKLSGGQKQRLSIARAVYKNPPILILDEATSALDTKSEKLVQEAIFKLMKNRTSLVIAHRLSTIQNADVIAVVKDGAIAEQGTHAELMELNGVYRSLVEMQQFG